MDLTARRLWIIKQVLAITDEALLKKIEHLILTDAIRNENKGVSEPTEMYLSNNFYDTLPKEVKKEIAKLSEKVL